MRGSSIASSGKDSQRIRRTHARRQEFIEIAEVVLAELSGAYPMDFSTAAIVTASQECRSVNRLGDRGHAVRIGSSPVMKLARRPCNSPRHSSP